MMRIKDLCIVLQQNEVKPRRFDLVAGLTNLKIIFQGTELVSNQYPFEEF